MREADDGPSVLVTEDEALISLDLCEALQEAGYRIIGPANTLESALFLLEWQRPQVAVVDVLLKDGSCAPLMHRLRRCGVPFLVHTGSARDDDLMALCGGAPWLAKPAALDDLIRTLEELHL